MVVITNRWIVLFWITAALLSLPFGLLSGEGRLGFSEVRALIIAAVGGICFGVLSGWSFYFFTPEATKSES